MKKLKNSNKVEEEKEIDEGDTQEVILYQV